MKDYKTLSVQCTSHVATIAINRPQKANALSIQCWKDLKEAFQWVKETPEVRVVVLRGNGKHFTAGIDLQDFSGLMPKGSDCEGRQREELRNIILGFQESFNQIERCGKPVIAAIHGSCIGAGVDMIAACDMRYCSESAVFSIKEVDIGITADVGTLQRLPHIIPDGVMRELAYTARTIDAQEAQRIGLVNQAYSDEETLFAEAQKLAETIASKAPLAIRGTKEMLLYTRDHNVQDSLNYVATWNAAMLMSNDLVEANMSSVQKRPPVFED